MKASNFFSCRHLLRLFTACSLVMVLSACGEEDLPQDPGNPQPQPVASCGNGQLESGEQCDDGANNGPDKACKLDCTINLCGNGTLDAGEQCDDGPNNGPDQACRLDCILSSCGDGKVGPQEECDDGDLNGFNKTCKPDCTANVCGDGYQGPAEECDGGTLCSPDCRLAWARSFGSDGIQIVPALAVDSNDSVYLIGSFVNHINFGGQELISNGDLDIFLAKLDSLGRLLWSDHFGDASAQIGQKLALGPDGSVYIVGVFKGQVKFGGDNLISKGENDIYLAKFDTDGNYQWSHSFGDAADQTAFDLVVTPDGSVYITGWLIGTVNFGGQALSAVGGTDIYFAKFDTDGKHVWSKKFGGDGYDEQAMSLALSPDNQSIYVTGQFQNKLDFGNCPLNNIEPNVKSMDVFLAKLTSNGTCIWSKRFGGTHQQFGQKVQVDSKGDVYLTGEFWNSINLGGSNFIPPGSDTDLYIAKFSPNGNHLWSKSFGGNKYAWAYNLEVSKDGLVYWSGHSDDQITFGDKTWGHDSLNEDPDSFLVRLDPASGGVLWSQSWSGEGNQRNYGLAVASDGSVYFPTNYENTIDTGWGQMTSQGAEDIMLLKLVPGVAGF